MDGGTNRWKSWLINNKLEGKLRPPSLITGDLDSCYPESLKYFSDTTVVKTPDQDDTDFTKALKVLDTYVDILDLQHVVVICESSGRFDQIIANINTLFKYNQQKPRPAVYILTSNSVTWLLPPTDEINMHEIYIPEVARKFWCSLVPIGSEAIVKTTGLKWNLDDDVMKFGGIVSTSNAYDNNSNTVKVSSNVPLVWSMGIRNED